MRTQGDLLSSTDAKTMGILLLPFSSRQVDLHFILFTVVDRFHGLTLLLRRVILHR